MSNWQIIMPVKYVASAKSRLGVSSESRHRLALAFAADSIVAARTCPMVAKVIMVHSPDPTGSVSMPWAVHGEKSSLPPLASGQESPHRAELVIHQQSRAGLNGAVSDGVEFVARTNPSSLCAVLLADIPSMRPGDLTEALLATEGILGLPGTHRGSGTRPATQLVDAEDDDAKPRSALIPDRSGTGTVLLAGKTPHDISPAFGADSAWAHAQGGASRIDLDLPRLRTDIDSPDDLRHAQALGLGEFTTAALRNWP